MCPELTPTVALMASMVQRALAFEPAPATQPAPQEPYERIATIQGSAFVLGWHQGNFFTPDGRLFLVADPDGNSVRLWNARTLKPVTEWLRHPELDAFSVSADAKTVFTSAGGQVRVWDVATSKPRTAVKVDPKRLRFFDSAADGKRFLTVSSDLNTLIVWNATGDRPAEIYRVQNVHNLISAQFDPTGTYIAAEEFAGPFVLVLADTGREVCPAFDTQASDTSSAPYQAQFDPSGRQVAVPLQWGLRMLECSSGKTVAETHWDRYLETGKICFSPDGLLVAVTTNDLRRLENGPVFLFEVKTGRRIRAFGDQVFLCQIAPGGRWALCNIGGHEVGGPEVWDLQTGVRVQTLSPPPSDSDHCATMSPDGQTILAGMGQGTISVWRMRQERLATKPTDARRPANDKGPTLILAFGEPASPFFRPRAAETPG